MRKGRDGNSNLILFCIIKQGRIQKTKHLGETEIFLDTQCDALAVQLLNA